MRRLRCGNTSWDVRGRRGSGLPGKRAPRRPSCGPGRFRSSRSRGSPGSPRSPRGHAERAVRLARPWRRRRRKAANEDGLRPGATAEHQQQVAELATQRRIIVYTVDMTLEVADVAASVDEVGALAQQMGGWVVSTSRAEKHRGFVAIRVPADRLDEVVGRLRGIAADVVSEISSSRDVTDEYVDPDFAPGESSTRPRPPCCGCSTGRRRSRRRWTWRRSLIEVQGRSRY